MGSDIAIWISWVLLFALAVLLYLINLWLALWNAKLEKLWRSLAWVPPLALYVSWKSGYRSWPILCLVFIILYGASRIALG